MSIAGTFLAPGFVVLTARWTHKIRYNHTNRVALGNRLTLEALLDPSL